MWYPLFYWDSRMTRSCFQTLLPCWNVLERHWIIHQLQTNPLFVLCRSPTLLCCGSITASQKRVRSSSRLMIDRSPWDSQSSGYKRCGIKRAAHTVTTQSGELAPGCTCRTNTTLLLLLWYITASSTGISPGTPQPWLIHSFKYNVNNSWFYITAMTQLLFVFLPAICLAPPRKQSCEQEVMDFIFQR